MPRNSDPQFVRLAPRLSGGSQVDLNTGWAISGLDVKEFPTGDSEADRRAAVWVRDKLRAGALEPASQAEYDEIQDANEEIRALEADRQSKALQDQIAGKLGLPQVGGTNFQESAIRAKAEEHAKRMQASREEREGTGYTMDKARREALASQQADDGSVDESGYESWTHKDLDTELQNRALSNPGGTKAQKAAVLVQHDADTGGGDGEEEDNE